MTNLSAHDVFWLARYAHNTLAPLIKAAQQYDPSTSHEIQMGFYHEDSPYYGRSHLTIIVRAKSQTNQIMVYSTGQLVTTTAQVDHWASKVQEFIDTEQAELEAKADFEAEHAARHESWMADAAADADFDAQQDRARERADIERDEDAHDIELQNEMAGN